MSKGENSVIHTKSAYAPELEVTVSSGGYSLDALYNNAYNHLRQAELSFYHQFFSDVNDIDTFIARIRKIFNDAEGVESYLKRFTNANLSKFLPKKKPYFEQGYKIRVTGDLEKIAFDYSGPSCYMKGDLYIAITPENAQLIKHILNTVLNRSGNNKFQDTNKVTDNLVKTLRSKGNELFEIVGSTSPVKKQQSLDITAVTKQEYNQGKDSEINKLLNSNSPEAKQRLGEIRSDMRKSLNEMKQFLFSGMPADPDLRRAVEETWKSVVPVGEDMLLRNYFFEGGNYLKALLGQTGEFYNKVILSYLSKKVNNPMGVEIIGSLLKGGKQPHTDLQIMTALGADIGFQTKNVSGRRNIDVNTDASLIQKNFGPNVVSALVNYWTNSSYDRGVIEEVKELLEDRFFQAMNLNVSPELDKMQTNTFYFAGGQHLIPGSEIIKEIMSLSAVERPHFDIKGGNVTPSGSDESYKGNFMEYWKYPKGENSNPDMMEATPKNAPAFNAAASSISIQTSFSLSALMDSGRFRIFY